MQFTIGFMFLQESDATTDLTGGRAQAAMLTCVPVTSCCTAQFPKGHGPSCSLGVGDLCNVGAIMEASVKRGEGAEKEASLERIVREGLIEKTFGLHLRR